MSGPGVGWPLLAALGAVLGLPGAPAGDVDLAKNSRVGAAPAWVGERVDTVLAAGRIERVILLKALTTTMSGRDLVAIRQRLDEAGAQPFLDAELPPRMLAHGSEDSIWEAVIVMDDGAVFGFTGGNLRGCLQAADGRRGCFDWAPPRAQ